MWVLFVLLGRRVLLPLLHGPGFPPDLISVSYLLKIWVELRPKARSPGSWTPSLAGFGLDGVTWCELCRQALSAVPWPWERPRQVGARDSESMKHE